MQKEYLPNWANEVSRERRGIICSNALIPLRKLVKAQTTSCGRYVSLAADVDQRVHPQMDAYDLR